MANSLNQSSNQEVIISVYLAYAGMLSIRRKWEGRVVWEGNKREGERERRIKRSRKGARDLA